MSKKETTGADSSANPWMFVSLFLGALLIASFVTNIYFMNKVTTVAGGAGPAAPAAPSAPSAPQQPTKVQITNPAQAPVLGNANAPVTITEFSDFQCPFCGRFHTQTFNALKTQYVDTGKAKIVFRHLPLPFHPMAQPAAEASMCANEQGKFWDFHNKVFENQDTLSEANLKVWATELSLDMTKFNDCVSTRKYQSYVEADAQAASAVGISGTPSFIVNGQLVVGAQPTAVFQQAIDAALKG